MFGYLTMHHRFLTYRMHQCYVNYYCGTCFALEHNFGQLSRLLLSNDVALLGILMECHPGSQEPRQLCFGKCREKHCRFHGGIWKQLAAMNLLLVQEKLKDDRNDDRSLRALAGMALLRGHFRKAEDKYPGMARAITQGYADMYTLEQAGSRIRPIEDRFAEMMVQAAGSFRFLEHWEELYIRHISRWVYYIDALDDYEADSRRGRFNALLEPDAETYDAYVKQYMTTIMDDLAYIYDDLEQLAELVPKDHPERALLRTMIFNDIPLRTSYVLSGRKQIRGKMGSIWEGADRYS
ncbi:MAG: DUF5685 family protein [Otoolea sp.]